MIYLLNIQEELIHIVSEDVLEEFVYKVELNTFDEAEFELPADYALEIWPEVKYFGFFHKDIFKVFKISINKLESNRYISGIDKAESDLRTVKIIKDKSPQNATAGQALYSALEGTGFEVGGVDKLPEVNSISFHYISPREALTKIIETWQCEFVIRYTFIQNKVTSRYIDLYKRQGQPTGRQFVYGDDLLSVVHEESDDEVVTALIGRGKAEQTDSEGDSRRLEFTDVVWSKATGNPVDKPAGSNYVTSEIARENYGLYQDGVLKHRWGIFVDDEIEDPNQLLQATYEELEKLSLPLSVFKANILSIGTDSWIGDTVAIIKDSHNIAFEARIQKLVIDKLNFDQTEVFLGDYQTLKNAESNRRGQEVKDIVRSMMSRGSIDIQAILNEVEKTIERKNSEIDEKIRIANLDFDNFKKLAEQNAKNAADKIAKTLKEDNDKAQEEIIKRLQSVDLSGSKDFEEIRQQLSLHDQILGSDGKVRYNKNLVDGNHNQIKRFEETELIVSVAGGIKKGQTYTISFEALCQLLEKTKTTFRQPNAKPLTLTLRSNLPHLKPVELEMSVDEFLADVVPYAYELAISSDWYQSKSIQIDIRNQQVFDLGLAYREVADGDKLIGEWAEVPEIIFDGGKS